MTLKHWLQRLETLHFKSIDLGLDRIRQVAERLDLFTGVPFVFTVGGTNGKGSTIALLRSTLCQAGYSVAAYTSPHLVHFNERIAINGEYASDQNIINALEAVEQARDDISLTYFEFTTLAAIWLFKQAGVDAWLLEVGLGGRLDAVNLWDADIAIITSIDLDHQQWLGDERATIGIEKLGIARAEKPLIVGEADVPERVSTQIRSARYPLFQIGRAFEHRLDEMNSCEGEERESWCLRVTDRQKKVHEFQHLKQPQMHLDNAAVAVQALFQSPFHISRETIQAGIEQLQLSGRQQIVGCSPQVMLDVGHNPHAARWLQKRLSSQVLLPTSSGRTHCIVGMLGDKAVADTLAELLAVVDVWYPVTLKHPRGMQAEAIQVLLQDSGAVVIAQTSTVPHQVYSSLLQSLSQDGQHQDRIVVFGSFFTVADILQQT